MKWCRLFVVMVIAGLSLPANTTAISVPVLASEAIVMVQSAAPEGKTQPLHVKGLVNGRLTGSDLVFHAPGAPQIDLKKSGANVFVRNNGTMVFLSDFWILDSTTNQVTIPAYKVNELIWVFPTGQLHLDIGLISTDGQFAESWIVPFQARSFWQFRF